VRRQKAVEKRVIKFVHLDARRLSDIALVIIYSGNSCIDDRRFARGDYNSQATYEILNRTIYNLRNSDRCG